MSDNKDKWPSEGLIGAVAQGWCTEANGGKVMDSDLAFDIATSVHRYLQSRAAQPVVLTDEQISDLKDAIGETEYKYFGCYEFSESQRTAVDVLVEVARMVIAAKEQA